MTRETTTEERFFTEVKRVTVSDVVICDICGRRTRVPHPVEPPGFIQWAADGGAYRELEWTQVRMEIGYTSPEGGMTKNTEIHICSICFPQLIDWVSGFRGARPTVTESEY